METVGPEKVIEKAKSLQFEFTRTKRGVDLDISRLSGDFIVDITGNIIMKNESSENVMITIIGGLDEFEWKKDKESGTDFYMTNSQINTISNICLSFASKEKFNGKVSSSDRGLDEIVKTFFYNGRS